MGTLCEKALKHMDEFAESANSVIKNLISFPNTYRLGYAGVDEPLDAWANLSDEVGKGIDNLISFAKNNVDNIKNVVVKKADEVGSAVIKHVGEAVDAVGKKITEATVDKIEDVKGALSVKQAEDASINYVELGNALEKKIVKDNYKIISIESSEIANSDWADMGYTLPPIASGTKVYNVEAGNFKYARVYKKGINRPKSPFLLRCDDINNLSASEIAEKYALSQTPDRIVYPKIPKETPLEVSIVGPQESWGTLGGETQYAIKDVLLEDDWFTDIHELK